MNIKLLFILFLGITLSTFGSTDKQQSDVIEYNDALVDILDLADKQAEIFIKIYNDNNNGADVVDAARINLINLGKEKLKELSKIKQNKLDFGMYDITRDFLKLFSKYGNTNLKKMVAELKKEDKDQEMDVDKCNQLVQEFIDAKNKLLDEFDEAQKKFASANNFTIE